MTAVGWLGMRGADVGLLAVDRPSPVTTYRQRAGGLGGEQGPCGPARAAGRLLELSAELLPGVTEVLEWQGEGNGLQTPPPAALAQPGGRQAVRWALGAVLVSCRTDQLGMFTNKELEQLGPVLDGFSLMTYDYPSPQQ